MEINYKELETDDLPNLRAKQVQKGIDYENAPQNDDEMEEYLDSDLFLDFLTDFHEGVLNKSSSAIINSLNQFFSKITYLNKDSNECKIMLSDFSPFLEQTPVITDDIIFCLSNHTFGDIHRPIFELIEYISGQSLFFIECFLKKDGIDQIIPYLNHEDEELVCKTIQFLGEFSRDFFIQKLVSDEFIITFFKICDSLFHEEHFKNTFGQISYYSSFLLRQIICMIVRNDQEFISLQQSTELENSEDLFYQQNNIEKITNLGFYDIIWYFFFKNENIPYSQSEAIDTFILLCADQHFVNARFPQILDLIPQMVQENKLIPQNKIKTYQLIHDVYKSNPDIDILILCIDPIRQDGKRGVPWDFLIESLYSENKNEIFAALDLFRTLFKYNPHSIEIALNKRLNIILVEIIQRGKYEIKTKALQTVYSWMSCHHTDIYNKSFVSFDFLDFIFPLLEADVLPDGDFDVKKKLIHQAYRVILQIFALNTRFPYLEQDSLDLYDKWLKDILRNSDIYFL